MNDSTVRCVLDEMDTKIIVMVGITGTRVYSQLPKIMQATVLYMINLHRPSTHVSPSIRIQNLNRSILTRRCCIRHHEILAPNFQVNGTKKSSKKGQTMNEFCEVQQGTIIANAATKNKDARKVCVLVAIGCEEMD